MLNTSVTSRAALLVVLVLQLSASAANGEPNEILRPAGAIALDLVEARVGPMAADADGERLYVAAAARPNAIVAIDAKSGKEIGRTSEGVVAQPWGAAFAPGLDRLIIANRAGPTSIYKGNLTWAGVVNNLDYASCVRYDPVSKLAYVGHGNGLNWIAVVDPKQAKKMDDIKLDGCPEGLQIETKGNRLFVNIPNMQQIAVIDRKKRAVVGIWPLQDPRWNFPQNYPMALDEEHHRLIVGCWNPAKVIVIDTDTGKIVSTIDCCPRVRDVYYDAQRKRIYASGNEYVSVIRQADPNTYKIVGSVATGRETVASLFVPATHKFYVAVPDAKPPTQAAELLIFDCGTDAAPTTEPAGEAAK